MPLWTEVNINFVASQGFSVLFFFWRIDLELQNLILVELVGHCICIWLLQWICIMKIIIMILFPPRSNQNVVRWLKRGNNFQIIICNCWVLYRQETILPISHFILFLFKFNAVISFKMCSTFLLFWNRSCFDNCVSVQMCDLVRSFFSLAIFSERKPLSYLNRQNTQNEQLD